jgi:hypothetical protein
MENDEDAQLTPAGGNAPARELTDTGGEPLIITFDVRLANFRGEAYP